MKFSFKSNDGKRQYMEISFSAPLWLTKSLGSIRYKYKKLKFQLRPFECTICQERQNIRQPEYEHIFANGRRLLVHNFAMKRDDTGRATKYDPYCVCRKCLVSILRTAEWKPRFSKMHELRDGKPSRYNYRFWSAKKCDITGKAVRSFKDVEVYPFVDMTFCTNAWNSGYISKEAIIECIEKGAQKTSRWGVYKGKMAMTNEYGLYVNDKGELL